GRIHIQRNMWASIHFYDHEIATDSIVKDIHTSHRTVRHHLHGTDRSGFDFLRELLGNVDNITTRRGVRNLPQIYAFPNSGDRINCESLLSKAPLNLMVNPNYPFGKKRITTTVPVLRLDKLRNSMRPVSNNVRWDPS